MRQIAGVFATLALVMTEAVPSLAQGIGEREFYRHHDWGFGHMVFGGLFMIAFWAAIIVLIVLAVRWLGGTGRHERRGPSRTALEILQERYARGEIDHDEFSRRKQLLSE